MIISLDEKHENYPQNFYSHQIFLNGFLQHNVVYADSDAGTIIRRDTDKDGELLFHNKDFVLITIVGDVTIVNTEGLCRTRMHERGGEVLAYDAPINIYADSIGKLLILDFDIADDGKITIHNTQPYYDFYCDIKK